VELNGILEDVDEMLADDHVAVGAVSPSLPTFNPQLIQQRITAVRPQLPPQLQAIVAPVQRIVEQCRVWCMTRRLERMLETTIPMTLCFDALPAATLSVVATMQSPYSGQPFEMMAMLANADQVQVTGPAFRATVINVGGIDFAEPSRSRVQYPAGAGAPVNPGLDLVTISGHNKQCCKPELTWRPWTTHVFDSSTVFTVQIYNYGTATGSCMITFMLRSSPCGNDATFVGVLEAEKLAKARRAIRMFQFGIRAF
jgi:hypothetical protein